MPEHTDFSAGGSNLSATWNNDITIAPGSYGSLSLGGKNKVYLSAGDYYFTSISSGTQPSLYLDLSGGDINIFVTGNVSFGDQLDIYVNSGSGYQSMTQGQNFRTSLLPLAAGVYLETLGSFSMSNQNEWFGTIFAQGNISFANQNKLAGAYYSSGGQVTTANQMEVRYIASDYALNNWDYQCGDGGGSGGGGGYDGYIPPISF